MNNKKGYCIHYFSHRGIGKIVEEIEDYKKMEKEMKSGQPGNDIYCVGCGPDMKTAKKNYNIDMKKTNKKYKLLKEKNKKIKEREKEKKKKEREKMTKMRVNKKSLKNKSLKNKSLKNKKKNFFQRLFK